MVHERRLVAELLLARDARQAFHRVGPLVSFQLQPAAEIFATFRADVLAQAVLLPQVSGHVVGLAEGERTHGAGERFLLRVRPHVSGEFVGPSEAPVDTDGTEMAFCFALGDLFRFTASILGLSFIRLFVFRLNNRCIVYRIASALVFTPINYILMPLLVPPRL